MNPLRKLCPVTAMVPWDASRFQIPAGDGICSMPAVANCRLMPSFPIGTSWGRPNASGRRAGMIPPLIRFG